MHGDTIDYINSIFINGDTRIPQMNYFNTYTHIIIIIIIIKLLQQYHIFEVVVVIIFTTICGVYSYLKCKKVLWLGYTYYYNLGLQ